MRLRFGQFSGGGVSRSGRASPPKTVVSSTAFFEENFNSHSTQDLEGLYRYDGDTENPGYTLLTGWSYCYSTEQTATNAPAKIVTGGRSGNCLQQWEESGGTGAQWGWHDFQTMKHFKPSQYTELWLTFWIKYNDSMATEIGSLNAAKIFRIGHYNPKVADGTTGTSIFNTNNGTSEGPTTSGWVLYDLKKVGDQLRHKLEIRSDPVYKPAVYDHSWEIHFADSGGDMEPNATYADTIGDSAWHKVEIQVIYGSVVADDSSGDGEVWLYWDGILQGGRNDVPYRTTGADADASGWNAISIGGNSDWNWGSDGDELMFFEIDDLSVSTERIT